jgi:broad specificity phosphatase PhoE
MSFPLSEPLTRLILIRHAQTSQNASGVISGKGDIALSEYGVDQAKLLSKRLATQYQVDYIYSSPLKRALETARIIANEIKLEITVDQNLVEFDYGIFADKPISSMKKENSQDYFNMLEWLDTDSTSTNIRPDFPSMESLDEIQKRIQKFTEMILKMHFSKTVLAVTHGGYLKMSVYKYVGGDFQKRIPFVVDNASISIIDFYKGAPFISLFNDIYHTHEKTREGWPQPP